MKVNHGSEMARMHAFQRRAAGIEASLQTAGKELSTGLRSNLQEATGGNLGKLHAIERTLAKNAAYARNITVVEQRLDAAQSVLGLIQEPLDTLSVDLVSAAGAGNVKGSMALAAGARLDFANAVRSLNTTVGGQTLFGGAGLDAAALATGEAILTELDGLVAGATTAADVIAIVEDYFAKTPTPGAFHTSGYLGASDDMGAVDVGGGTRVAFGYRADDDEVVAVLKGLALAAVVAGGALGGNQAERMDVIAEAGAQLLQAKEGLLDYRSGLGVVQENLETAKARNTGETDTLERARINIVSADATEAATIFQALEAQLETVYTVTSRLSGLRFVNFMGR